MSYGIILHHQVPGQRLHHRENTVLQHTFFGEPEIAQCDHSADEEDLLSEEASSQEQTIVMVF